MSRSILTSITSQLTSVTVVTDGRIESVPAGGDIIYAEMTREEDVGTWYGLSNYEYEAELTFTCLANRKTLASSQTAVNSLVATCVSAIKAVSGNIIYITTTTSDLPLAGMGAGAIVRAVIRYIS